MIKKDIKKNDDGELLMTVEELKKFINSKPEEERFELLITFEEEQKLRECWEYSE
jgi:hypothetical protein